MQWHFIVNVHFGNILNRQAVLMYNHNESQVWQMNVAGGTGSKLPQGFKCVKGLLQKGKMHAWMNEDVEVILKCVLS